MWDNGVILTDDGILLGKPGLRWQEHISVLPSKLVRGVQGANGEYSLQYKEFRINGKTWIAGTRFYQDMQISLALGLAPDEIKNTILDKADIDQADAELEYYKTFLLMNVVSTTPFTDVTRDQFRFVRTAHCLSIDYSWGRIVAGADIHYTNDVSIHIRYRQF